LLREILGSALFFGIQIMRKLNVVAITVAAVLLHTHIGISSSRAEEPSARPIVIAHRGACGYVPEHTEAAKVLALSQGADFVEQDVVLSKDGVFVVTHDITMEATTNVEEKFEQRVREDGKYYFADFTWSEIQSLAVHERTDRSGKQAFENRFPGSFNQRLMRLEDEIRLIQGWNTTRKTNVGIYVELKAAAWHAKQFGYSMGERLLPLLAELGYRDKSDACFIQCFEPDELKRLKAGGCSLRLIQLTGGDPAKFSQNGWPKAMQDFSAYADGVGPSLDWLVKLSNAGEIESSGFVEAAHAAKLAVHPYTVRLDQLPKWAKSIDELHRVLIADLKVDGFFTDFPDVSHEAVVANR
jgi:glycerophosphoryl diester phosphodiesterase